MKIVLKHLLTAGVLMFGASYEPLMRRMLARSGQ